MAAVLRLVGGTELVARKQAAATPVVRAVPEKAGPSERMVRSARRHILAHNLAGKSIRAHLAEVAYLLESGDKLPPGQAIQRLGLVTLALERIGIRASAASADLELDASCFATVVNPKALLSAVPGLKPWATALPGLAVFE